MATAKQATSKASTEISTETNTAAQEEVKINLPSLPDTFSEESLLNRFKEAQAEYKSVVPDVETEQGRKDIKDIAKKVSADNKALDTPMRDYLRILKTQPKALEKNARESKARFDELKAEILKPLEEAQQSQNVIIEWLDGIPAVCGDPGVTSNQLNGFIETINSYTVDLVWPELKKKFKVAHENALTTATVTLERIEVAEANAEKLAELEAQAAKQKQIDHDREIAEAAAEKARVDAENKAQRDREDVDRRAAEFRQREENAKAAEAQAKRDAELAKENQAKAEAQAKVNAENERVASEKRQAEAVEKAKVSESKRIADEEEAQAKAAQERENDKAHRIAINRAALVDLVAAGIDAEVAKDVIRAIAKKQVRNISIQY